ncbi:MULTISPECIES: hypothetical protein [Methylobacterium]|uniref:MotE family protein n=1 Tax=Methylobacterium TaxID=407 RepID=UPI002F2C0900
MTLTLLLRRFAGLPDAPVAAGAQPQAAAAAFPSAGAKPDAAPVAGRPAAGAAGAGKPMAATGLPAKRPQAPVTLSALLRRLTATPAWRGPMIRLRLVDAVAVAACGLLFLKVLAFLDAAPSTGSRFAEVLAHARSGWEPADPTVTGSVSPKETAPAPTTSAPPAEPPRPSGEPVSSSERAILEKLGARRDALQQRSRDLETREQLIENAERKLESRINDLKTLEQKGDDAAAKRAEAEAAGLKSLVTMYETMKPKEAARVFDRLKLDVLVPVVVAMNPRKMAEVLAVMQPEAAERLTVALAQRARGAGGPKSAAVAPGLPPGELPAIDGVR